MKPNLRLFKIFLVLIAFMVGNFTFAQQKAQSEKEKLAKEMQVAKASELSQDVIPGVVSKFNYDKPVFSNVDYSKKGNRGLLYDNGPFVTHPGGGPGGADVSFLEAPNTSYGSNFNFTAGYRVADNFTVDGDWSVDSLVVYGYQTNSTTASTFTGLYIQIWNGDPSLAGSTIVWGDMTTNRLIHTYWSNCYRAQDLVGTARPIMANVAAVAGLTLPAGEYWIDYATTGSLSSGPWANPITILGQIETGNALQWTGAAWQAIVDAGSTGAKGLPFLVYGDISVDPDIIYATDFEDFTAGVQVACQDNVNWTTWSNAPCGPEDGMVSTDFAHSGVNSVKIDGTNDLVLPMGNKVDGKYQFEFQMFIPTGHGGYYNLLHNFAGASSEWGLEFYFEDAGTAQLHAGGMIIPIAYLHDQWMEVTNVIDIDNDLAEVFLDGVSVYSWQWSLDPSTGNPGLNQLSATDFYSGQGATGIVNPLYYFDDLEYKNLSEPPPTLNPPRNLAGVATGQNVHLTWDPPQSGDQFFEGFEDGTLPTGWLAIDHDGDGYNWLNTIEQGFGFTTHTGDGAMTSASYMNNVGPLTPDNWLITPAIEVTGTSQLIYWHAAQDASWADEHYYVKVSTTTPDLASFTEIIFDGVTPTDWEEVTLDLAAFAGQTVYIAFQHCEVTDMFYMKLDDVSVTNTATRALATPKVAPSQNQGFAFKTAGLSPEQIAAKKLAFGNVKASRALLGYNVYRDGTKLNASTITDLFYDDLNVTPGTYEYTATAVYDEGESAPVGPIEITVHPGGLTVVTIGDGVELPGSGHIRTPFDYYWKNSIAESLYFPDEIGQPAGTQILQVEYHNNFSSTTIGEKQVQIFMGETSLMDLTGGFIPAGDLTLVFDGLVNFPAGINDITIPLDVPYIYNGDNLVILTYHVLEPVYYSSLDRWYSTTTPEYPSRTVGASDDNIQYDPYNPPAAEFTEDFIPNTTLYMMPGGGSTIYATDFETFTVGEQVACQDPVNWTTWSNAPCSPTEDAYISDEFAHSPVKSAKVILNNDLVLLMGNKTEGKYELNFDMYMPTGYCGYYNILQEFAGASSIWGMQLYLHTDGTASLDAGGVGAASFNYNHDQWLHITNIIDLDSDLAELVVDGVSIYSWQWTLGALGSGGPLQIGAADFFGGADANYPSDVPMYYFDDVEYKSTSAPPSNPRIVVTPASFSVELEPNMTTTQTMNIANTGGGTLDFNIDISYLVKSVRIVNHQPQYERVTEMVPVKGGKYMVEKHGQKVIPEVVDPSLITKGTAFANKHVPSFSRSTVYVNQTGSPSSYGGIASQTFEPANAAYSCSGADDFDVPAGATWNVNHVFVGGTYSTGTEVPAVDVVFYADAAGLPGAAVYTYTGITAESETSGNVNIFLPTPATLTEGRYWVAVAANMAYGTYGQWYWSREADPLMLNEFTWQNPGGGFAGCTTWCYGSVQWPGQADYNLAFALSDSAQAPPPTGWLAAAPLSGSVPADGSVDVTVTFDATGLPVGDYNGLLSISSNDPNHPVKAVPALLEVKIPGAMPLIEDWSSGSFATNDWTFDPAQSNWVINTSHGNPAPSAAFNWSPSITNYSFALVSPMLNATAITDNVTLKYDIELNNYSTSTLEGMAVEVYDGTTWQLVADYPNTNGSFSWLSESQNITAFAGGHNFSVRFRAYGEDSFNINYWYIDNIKIYQQVVGNLTGTITQLSDGAPVEGALVAIENALSGTYTALSGVDGVYTITGAEAGDYALEVHKDGYNVIEDNIAVIGNQTVTENYALTAPIISVDPTSLSVTVPVGETTTRTVTVYNTGNGPMDWSGRIQNTVGPVVLYQTDFEAFEAGAQVACQDNVNWTTWSNAPCGPEDGMVSTDYAASPVKSVKIDGTNDLVLLMGNKTSGKYEYTFNMYVPSNFCGYYNLLQNFAGGSSEWGFEAYFHTDGTGYINAAGNTAAIFNYTHDVWMPIKNVVDLDNDLAEFYLNGVLIHTWQWSLGATGTGGLNQLGATDFFAGAEGSDVPTYYFDDIVYKVADTKQMVNIPASNGNFPRGAAAPSIGRAPAGTTVNPASPIPADVRASLGYACDIYPGYTFFSFMTDNPGTPTVISTISNEPFGGSFDAVNTDFYYVIDYGTNTLQTMDLATGAVTNIGSCMPFGAESWTGLAVDKSTNIMYGISTDISESHIYTIDMATGASTVIGATGIPGAIDCAIDGTGQMYSYDLVNDEAYKIDKATGASTLLGSIGFDANYAQGMSWDPVEDIICLAAYNNDGSGGQLRILDRETGNTTLVGGFSAGGEVDALGFPGGGGGNWASIEPTSGTIEAFGSQVVTVTFDGNYVPPQKDLTVTGVLIFSTDPDVGSPEVALSMTITGSFMGVLEGTVTHGGTPVEGVTVTATRQESPIYTYTMVTGANGMYSFPTTLYGTYDFTAEKAGFNPYTSTTPAVVVGDQTTVYNIAMVAPMMVITPGELTVTLPVGSTTDRTLNINNSGDGMLYWTGSVHTNSKQVVSIPASNGEFPRGTAAPSIGRAPEGSHVAGNPEFQVTSRSMGYAMDIYPGDTFFSFNTDDPGTQNVISSISGQPFGGTFDAVNTDFYYIIDYGMNMLQKVDLATGAITDIGSCISYGGQSWTGISVDKTTNIMYGISTDISESYIYTIDMVTGTATVIGPTGIPGAIDCAIDGTGQMYAFDLVNDEAYAINKETGASTVLGSIGYDANYAQGMGWDPETDIIYLAAYNNDGSGGQLRILDRVSGNTALVGGFPGGDEVDALGFPGGGSVWLSMDPKFGTIPAGNSQNTTVHFDATELELGTYTGYITFLSEPNVGTVTVPVTLIVGQIGGPTLTITEVYNVSAGAVSVPVHAEEIVNMGSFQFTLDYNAAYLTYTGVSNWYPGITDVLINADIPGKLTFVWAASSQGITMNDDTFFNLDFTFTGTLDWAWIGWSDNPTPREFADWDGNIINPTYNNGFVTGHGVGVPETGTQAIKVYPNPASDLVNVKSDYTIKNIEVLSYLGQIVYTENNLNTKLVQFNVSSLNSGVYFVKINTTDGIKTTKITVKR